MARGKQTCRILKEIRRQIAEANDIEFVTSECRYKGDCLGTCPKCEAEVRYLEQQLQARTLAGKAIALAGISAGVMLMTGCGSTPSEQAGNRPSEAVQDDIEIPAAQEDTLDSMEEGELPCLDTVSDAARGSRGVKGRNIPDGLMPIAGELSSPEDVKKEEAPKPPTDDDLIFGSIEQDPQFPGGQQALLDWIAQHIVYPEDALADSIQGRVTVQFVIDSLGYVGEVKVMRGKLESLDMEAVRVVKSLPRFTPGKMNGKPVNAWYTLPVIFKLKD